MASSRRTIVLGALASTLVCAKNQTSQDQTSDDPRRPLSVPNLDQDHKLPNGKSQKNEIAKSEHEKALHDAQDLVSLAQQLRDELQKAGDFVVPLASVRRTEDIEKLARKIRGRLKD